MQKTCNDTRVVQTDLVLPNDTNNHNTLFGGVLMKKIDAVASIAARRHCRTGAVTASTDSVDFLLPIRPIDSVCLEAFVVSTGKSSMEVFVKVIRETLNTGERKVAATAFLTFVSVDENGVPQSVEEIVPESPEEKLLHASAGERAEMRKTRRMQSKSIAQGLSTEKPWARSNN
ncbi:acyl-CoA thioesterase [Bacillus bombysepticus]|uniref:acyl-CoA thioesterase n=1 Tax=Bacillus bombysepticus TaxID=658666 RepID=UPI003015B52C